MPPSRRAASASSTAAAKPPSYRVTRSAIHGDGVFAAKNIRKGAKIIEYIGERIDKVESELRAWALYEKAKTDGSAAVYIFSIDEDWDIDGDVPGNDAKLINHSCNPNCEAFDYAGRIWICAKRAIREGEELTFNYGFELENWEDHPCRCGSQNCVGYIVAEEYWHALHLEVKKKEKAAKKAEKAAAKTSTKAPAKGRRK